MPPDRDRFDYKDAVNTVSVAMSKLGTGPLAELRRMEIGGPGCAAFWVLADKGGLLDQTRFDPWMRLVKIMAILTPKGERSKGVVLHKPSRRLGAVLCDGGDPGWKDANRPFLSESRLARFLAQPADQHGIALERIARALANHLIPESGLDCVAVAALLLFSDSGATRQALARDYYRRLDSANHPAKPEEADA